MKKKTYAILSGVTLLALGGALALSHANKFEGLIFKNQPKRQLNTFVIDEDTTFTSQGDYYQGVAISEGQVELTTKFTGFDLEDGRLTVEANSPVFFTNVTPMNVGFDSFHCEFSGTGTFKYTIMVFFSYFELVPDDIIDGQYADLQRYGHAHVETTSTLEETVTISDIPGMIDCKYVLGVIISESALTLEEMEFGTPCTDQVPVVSEKGTFSDYTTQEKALMNNASKFGELLPFFGHGGYYLHAIDNNEILVEGLFADENIAGEFVMGIMGQGYNITKAEDPQGENDYGNYWLQKQDGNVVRTVDIEFCANALFTVKTRLTLNEEMEGLYTSWPTDLFRDVLSEEFADFVIDNQPDLDDDVYFQAMSEQDDGETWLALFVGGYDTEFDAISDITTYINDLLANYPEYYLDDDSDDVPASDAELFDDFEYFITDGIHTIGVLYEEGEGVIILLTEPILKGSFPTELINEYLGLDQGVSFPTFPATTDPRFSYDEDDAQSGSKFNIDVYFASQEELDAYCQALENFGLTRTGTYETSYSFTSNIFDSYSVYVSFYHLENDHRIDIEFNRSGSGSYSDCASFGEGLTYAANYCTYCSHLITDHEYPTLSGDHIIRYCNSESSYNGQGIYISDLGQSYLDALLADAEFDPYFNAYVFEDESDGDFHFAIQAEVVSGGIRINPITVEVNSQCELVDSTVANQRLHTLFENTYAYLEDSDPTKYAAIMAGVTDLPNSNGEKVYSIFTNTYTEFGIYGENRIALANAYGQALQNNGYTYSKLLKMYSHSNGVISASRNDDNTNASGNKFIYFRFDVDTSVAFIDFVSYADANISGFETSFAEFPHEGNEKLFYRASGSDTIYTSEEFDLAQFAENLEDNGFKKIYYGGSETRYEKQYGDSLLQLSIFDYASDYGNNIFFGAESGFHRIVITEYQNYFESFEDVLVNSELDAIPAKYKNLLPTFESSDELFHIRYASSNSLGLTYKSSMDINDFISAMVDSGYVRTKSNRLYKYDGTNMCDVYIGKSDCSITFSFSSYDWTTYPTYAQSLNTLYYFLHDYILMPDETGNVFFTNPSSGDRNSFEFYLNSSVDVEAYVEKLEEFGYEEERVTRTRAELRYQVNGLTINFSISRDNAFYRVRFECYDSFDLTVNMGDLNSYLIGKGYTNMNILPSTESLSFTSFYMSTYDSCDSFNLGGNLTDGCAETIASVLTSNGYENLGGSTYTKEDANYRYSIDVNGTSINVNVYKIY